MVRPRLILLPALVLVLLLSACEESVDPFLDTDRNFSLFGTLDMARDTQFVRVVPIRQTLVPNTDPLDVTFTSTDLATNETLVWRDSVITFESGTVGHVFYAPLRVRPDHTYRIEVHRPDTDVVTVAETTVPAISRAVVEEENVPATGGISPGTQQILWPNVDREPFHVELYYRFVRGERLPFLDVLLPYEPPGTQDGDAWVVNLNLRQDRLTLDTLVSVPDLPLAGLGMRITVLDDKFVPPGGAFDPQVLAQPGVFSNVENGFGFVGSVGRYSTEWLLSNASARRMGYLTLEDYYGKNAAAIRERLLREPASLPAARP